MKKFNFLDVIILIGVAAVAIVGIGMLRNASGAEQADQAAKVVYTVEDADAPLELVQAVQIGDRVNIGVNGVDSSVVTDVQYKPAEKVMFDSLSGTYLISELPDKYELQVTCEAEAAVSDMSISAGSTPIRVGAEFSVKGRGYAVIGYVIQSDLVE